MKHIILAFDGTGNQFGLRNTNVIKLLQAIDMSAPVTTFYESGIGTFPYQGVFSEFKAGFANLLKQMVGKGIRNVIRAGYRYLIDVYRPGDKVYLYGFSRGAYTARALAGLLHDYGLLTQGHSNLVLHASKLYHQGRLSATNPRGVPDPIRYDFQKLFTKPCVPELVGVWDTVGSLGIIYRGEQFVNTLLNKDVPLGLQALAIHEERSRFPASVWSNTLESDGITRQDTGGIIKQVWFAGAHADVGGGYPDTGLSDYALQWMLEESAGAGLPVRDHWQTDQWPIFRPDFTQAKHDEYRTLKWRFCGRRTRELPPGCFVHASAFQWARHHGVALALPDKYHIAP